MWPGNKVGTWIPTKAFKLPRYVVSSGRRGTESRAQPSKADAIGSQLAFREASPTKDSPLEDKATTMHTLVIWAAAVSLTPLVIGIVWESLVLFREAMSPPASGPGARDDLS